MSLEDRLLSRKSFPGRDDIIVATRDGDLFDLNFTLSRSDLGRYLGQLQALLDVKDSRRRKDDPPLLSVTASNAAIEGKLREIKTWEDLEALIILGEHEGVFMRIGRKIKLMAPPRPGVPKNSPSAGIDISDILQRVGKRLMKKGASDGFDDWASEDDDDGELPMWARIRRVGDDAAVMLKLSTDGPPRSLTQRVKAFFSQLPTIKDSEILGPTSAFVSAGPPVTLFGRRHLSLAPVDAETRRRLVEALRARGMGTAAPFLLAPASLVTWQRLEATEEVAEGLSPVELAYRLARGMDLTAPPKLDLAEVEARLKAKERSPYAQRGRVLRDPMPSPQRLAVDLGKVTRMEPRPAPPKGRGRKTHSTIQNPPPQKSRERSDSLSEERAPEETPVERAPLKRGSTRRVSPSPERISLLAEPVVRLLETTVRAEAEREKEAHRDRVF